MVNTALLENLPLSAVDRAEFAAFCAPNVDRRGLLTSSLERRGIHFETIPIGDAVHIAVPVNNAKGMDKEYFRVTLVAHYDRVPNSPGANDNSAAVFQLLAHLEEIRQIGWNHRTQVIFTDKEELTGDDVATSQGSFELAHHLKRLGAKNILFLVLDMCGIGDTPVWGRSIRKAGLVPKFSAPARAYSAMEGFLKRYTGSADYGVNPMFSDDLGLLLGGYPALQLSLLPRKEAMELALRFGHSDNETDPEAPAQYRESMRRKLPPCWRLNHSPGDLPETLDAASFLLMARLLRDLARYRFPLR